MSGAPCLLTVESRSVFAERCLVLAGSPHLLHFQVSFALYLAQDVIINLSLVLHLYDGSTFCLNQFMMHPLLDNHRIVTHGLFSITPFAGVPCLLIIP